MDQNLPLHASTIEFVKASAALSVVSSDLRLGIVGYFVGNKSDEAKDTSNGESNSNRDAVWLTDDVIKVINT